MNGDIKYVAKRWRKRVGKWEKQVRELSYWLLHDVDEEDREEGDDWWDVGFDGELSDDGEVEDRMMRTRILRVVICRSLEKVEKPWIRDIESVQRGR